ncbi:MAG: hypothetical protein P8Z37_14240 [Acidobacteriota bacterium]
MANKYKIGKALPKSAIRFRPEYLDFKRGIRVGNLGDNERITRILKLAIEDACQTSFVTERYGRGVYWQWIGFLSRANRAAKPVSSNVGFGCSKFVVTIDPRDSLFKCGFSVERGFAADDPDYRKFELKPDWDWNRLVKQTKEGSPFYRELRRLVVREGFAVDAGSWEGPFTFRRKDFPGPAKLRKVLRDAPGDSWAGFQVYYPMKQKDVAESAGADLIEAMLAVFREVTAAMNCCMQEKLKFR